MEPFLFKHEDKLYQVKTSELSKDVRECCNLCAFFNNCTNEVSLGCECYLCPDQYFVEYENQQIQINPSVNRTGVSSVQRQRRR